MPLQSMNKVFKRIGKKIYSFFVRDIIPLIGRIFRHRNKFINVIYYHDIVRDNGYSFMRTNHKVFERQMEWLVREGYETLRFDDIEESNVRYKKKRIIIAFDDGWRSNYSEIFNYMKQRGLKYNVFLTIGEIGENPEYLTWEMVKEMHDSGLVGFGAHTFSHPSMADLSLIDYKQEVNVADEIFNQKLGYYPLDFCYPFGYYTEESNLHLEKESSYKRIYTSKKMYSYEQSGKLILGRNGISNDDSMRVFRNKVDGDMNVLKLFEDRIFKPMLQLYHKIKN